MTVYCREIKEVFDVLEEKIEETREKSLITGEDFSARIGIEGRSIKDEKDEINRRRSRDKVINKEGREMLARIEEEGWAIMNGSKEEESELWTYVGGKGEPVIDYIVANERADEDIHRVRIRDRTELDHLPIEMTIQGRIVGGREEERRRYGRRWKEKKRLLRKELRKWRKGKVSREEYVKERKRYKRWCEEERKRQEKEVEEKVGKIKTETETCRYINKFGKKRNRWQSTTDIKKWKRHFMDKLEGTEKKTGMERRRKEEQIGTNRNRGTDRNRRKK